MKIKLIIYVLVLILTTTEFSCVRSSSNETKKNSIDQRQAYYERIPDAPIDLYCHVNDLLDDHLRKELCLSVMFSDNKNLSVDMGIVVKDNQLDTIEIQTLYFDQDGLPKKDSVNFKRLNELLNSIDIQQIPTLKNLGKADFVVRLQIERFCIGYVHVNEPEIMSLIDSAKKRRN